MEGERGRGGGARWKRRTEGLMEVEGGKAEESDGVGRRVRRRDQVMEVEGGREG